MAKHKKHIVLLTSEFPPLPGGIGNHAYNLAEQLEANGYDVSVIADQRDTFENESEFDDNLKSTVYRIALKSSRFKMYFKRVRLFLKLSKTADIVICSGKFPLWIGSLFTKQIKAKTIAVIHGSEVNFSKSALRKSINWSLKRFDSIIAVSNFTKSLVADLNLKQIEVIPNGFTPSIVATNAHIEINGNPKLLTVGNVTERKGQINVINHLTKLKDKYPNVHYHCVGLKTDAADLELLAERLNVLQHVTFHGHVSKKDLVCFYQNSDIFVMLSQTTNTGDVEGFGIALIESNYFGLPTIGALNCGIEDAINHNESGCLVNAKNYLEFETAVTSILNNKNYFSKSAKTWAKQHEWILIIKKYIKIIES